MTDLEIAFDSAYYIKLGRGGSREQDCLEQGLIYFGTGSGDPHRYALARAADWDAVRRSFLEDGHSQTVASQFSNNTRQFFEDDGATLWFTFSNRELWWGFLEPSPPTVYPEWQGTVRKVAGSWRNTAITGRPLRMLELAGSLTKAVAYRGTLFRLDRDRTDYLRRRINGQLLPEVEAGASAIAQVEAATRRLLTLLEPQDFELLVDLIFTHSGWRRLGELGRTTKDLDLEVELPSTGERAWIQVKSKASDAVLAESVAKVDLLPYPRLFFVYHTGEVHKPSDGRVLVIGPNELATLVVDAGLVRWLIDKVS